MRPLRILHLVANRWWTGSADPALDLAQGLRARGHRVWFGCIPGDVLEARVEAAGLPRPDGLWLAPTARPWTLVSDLVGLRRFVREQRVEIVHTHLTHDHWLACVALRGRGVRLVRSVHHRRAARPGRAARWLFGATDALIASSVGIAEALRVAGASPGRIVTVPGAVDVRRFAPEDGSAARARLGLTGRRVVGCVARIVPGRGHDVLVRAVAALRRRLPDLVLLLVGRGEGQPAVEHLVRELDLAGTVVFLGYRGEDLPQVLSAMECFVLLGVGSEESGRAVLEAMATGLPVVAGRAGALPETVVDGETGWLVGLTPDVVAARIGALLDDPARARAMGAAGRRRVEDRFTPEGRAHAVEATYRRVLGEAGPEETSRPPTSPAR